MIVIEYDPVNGKLISDSECLSLPTKLIGETDVHWIYSNELIVHTVIDAMLDGLFSQDQLIIRYQGEDFEVDELGFIIGNVELTRTKLSNQLSSKRLSKLK